MYGCGLGFGVGWVGDRSFLKMGCLLYFSVRASPSSSPAGPQAWVLGLFGQFRGSGWAVKYESCHFHIPGSDLDPFCRALIRQLAFPTQAREPRPYMLGFQVW